MFDLIENNNHFVVINKHANVSVHKDQQSQSLLMAVQAKLSEQAESLYLVHRLDKMTSGLLILAKNADTASKLSALFREKQIEKYYLAIGSKKPKKKQGMICGDMARSRRSSWKLLTSTNNPARTQFFSTAGEAGQRLFLCKPHTGKTHQIRVALASIGSPILGDPIYNTQSKADRGYLHAYALGFEFADKHYQFICSPTQGEHWQTNAIRSALVQWQEPWTLNWPKYSSSLTLQRR